MKTMLNVAATLKRGLESRDADALISLYHDKAELRIIDRNSQPSRPRKIVGKTAIAKYLKDVCGREMTHHVEHVIEDDGRIAFTEACEYPDGTKVYSAGMLETNGEKILGQVNVQAWDEEE